MTRSLFCLTITGIIAACASAPATGRHDSCALSARDSLFLTRGPVYRECAVDHRASPTDRSAHPEFNPTTPPAGGKACYSAEVEFVVDTAGVPEEGTTTVVHTNNPDFAAAVVAVVHRWRYRPATIKGAPVRQIVDEKIGLAREVVVVPMGQPPTPGRPPMC